MLAPYERDIYIYIYKKTRENLYENILIIFNEFYLECFSSSISLYKINS
jgi:hypothetical protein